MYIHVSTRKNESMKEETYENKDNVLELSKTCVHKKLRVRIKMQIEVVRE